MNWTDPPSQRGFFLMYPVTFWHEGLYWDVNFSPLEEIIQYLKDVQAMNSDSLPQYESLRSLLTKILFSSKAKQNASGLQFDWLKREVN